MFFLGSPIHVNTRGSYTKYRPYMSTEGGTYKQCTNAKCVCCVHYHASAACMHAHQNASWKATETIVSKVLLFLAFVLNLVYLFQTRCIILPMVEVNNLNAARIYFIRCMPYSLKSLENGTLPRCKADTVGVVEVHLSCLVLNGNRSNKSGTLFSNF